MENKIKKIKQKVNIMIIDNNPSPTCLKYKNCLKSRLSDGFEGIIYTDFLNDKWKSDFTKKYNIILDDNLLVLQLDEKPEGLGFDFYWKVMWVIIIGIATLVFIITLI